MTKKTIERKGILLVISGPSGTGKSTLINKLISEYPNFGYSISHTTREARKGEVNGREYNFCSRETFEKLIEQDFFAEWARVHGNYYGTPRKPVLSAVDKGQDLIFDIDVQGAKQLRNSLNFGCFIFLFPPSLKKLHSRLLKRGTDQAQKIKSRLENAVSEIRQSESFDYWLVNDDLEKSYNHLKCIVQTEKSRPAYNPGLLQKFIDEVRND
ncbi:MAG: guanylate kinase [Thermodesulfobacteriota bacterium]